MAPSEQAQIKSFDDLAGIAAEFDDACRIVENSFDTKDEEWQLGFSNGYCLALHVSGRFRIRRA